MYVCVFYRMICIIRGINKRGKHICLLPRNVYRLYNNNVLCMHNEICII